jgi:hypothetical protein
MQATQYPIVTTGWFEVTKDGNTMHTWIPITYTQTFPILPFKQGSTEVPSGSIGLGMVQTGLANGVSSTKKCVVGWLILEILWLMRW